MMRDEYVSAISPARSGYATFACTVLSVIGLACPGVANGADWEPLDGSVPGSDLRGVWGSGPTDVYAVGGLGKALHYDGSGWSEIGGLGEWKMLAVWGRGPNSVYVSGIYGPNGYPESGMILKYDGDGSWSEEFELPSWETWYSTDFRGGWQGQRVYAVTEHETIYKTDYSGCWWPIFGSGGDHLNGVWGVYGVTVFAVGDNGTLLQEGGSPWPAIDGGTEEDLQSVWGSSPNDVYIVGDAGTALHYDGTDCSPMTSGTTENLNGVWCSGPNDVFAVGDGGVILHYDGVDWSPMTSGTTENLTAVWGSGPSDVFAVGDNGTILHYGYFRLQLDIPRPDLGSVDVQYAIVAAQRQATLTPERKPGGEFSHWEGDVPAGHETDDPLVVVMDQDRTITAVFDELPYGEYYFTLDTIGKGSTDPNTGTTILQEGTEVVLTASTVEGWWFVEWQGDVPPGTETDNPLTVVMDQDRTITALFQSPPPDLEWEALAPGFSGQYGELRDVGGSGPNNVIALGTEATLHFDGSSWTLLTIPSELTHTMLGIQAIWVHSPNDAFIVGYAGAIGRYDGSTWTPMPRGSWDWHRDVWGSEPNDLFVVGYPGRILHYDGSTWTTMLSGSTTLFGVWGSGPNDVFAVGGNYQWIYDEYEYVPPVEIIRHYNGSSWSVMPYDLHHYLNAVWGSGPSDVFAVGNGGSILHYDGASWSAMDSDTDRALNDVWGSGPNDVYAVGYRGTILHYNGSAWSKMNSGVVGTRIDLTGVWGSGPNDVYVVGEDETILHFPRWQVTADASPPGMGSVAIAYGRENHVTLTAQPGGGAGFSHWEGDEPVDDQTDNPLTLGLNGDLAVTAVFEVDPNYAILTVNVQGDGAVDPNGGVYDAGDEVVLTATAADGWHFVEWQGDLTGSINPAPITMDVAKTVTAVFEENPPVLLTVAVQGQGSVDPNGGTYDEGTELTLTATPADGWHFVEWLGDLTGSANPAPVTMDADKTVTAVFQENPPGQHALTVALQGQGSVDPNSGTYDEGTELTLTATAADGWHFVEWLGDLTGSANPVPVTLDADKTITAVFEQDPPIQYTLSTAVQGQGSVDPNGGTYEEGSGLTLTATPADGWHFVQWLGDLTGSANPGSLTMDADKNVTAIFQQNPPGQYALTVTVQGQGSVDPNGGTYDDGTELSLTAAAADGWHFVNWAGDLTGSANPAPVTIDADKTITAVFEQDPPIQYMLSTAIQGQGSVDPNGGTYEEGSGLTLTATPADGWHFVEWLGDLTGSANPGALTMDADKTVTAVFQENPPGQRALTLIVQGEGSVDPNGGTYDEGTELILTATPARGWRFVEWQGDMPGPANPARLRMNADKTITAVFVEDGSDGLGCWAMQGVLALPFVGLLWVMLGRRRRDPNGP